MFQFVSNYSELAGLVLRVVVALIFLVHGWPKLKNLRMTAENFNAMGFRPGALWGTVVSLNEVIGGLALLVGFLTPLITVLLAGQMVVATLWKIKRGQGLAGGFELDLLLVASALVIATLGGGIYSLD